MSDLSSFSVPLQVALRHALEHIDGLPERSVDATVGLDELRRRFDVPLGEQGVDAARVITELAEAADGGIVGTAGPRFFGFVIGGSLPAALAADWLTSAWDQNAGLYACGPAAAVVEEVVGVWLKSLLGLPAQASFALVTGCQMAHVTCLAAARNAVLAKAGWDVERDGLAGSPRIRIITSSEQHITIPRAARLLGLGTGAIELLPCDASGRLPTEALRDALERGPKAPTIVVLQAGDLNMGAFDDFAELVPVAHEHGAWVHVDGAFGLWCAASSQLRHLLAGCEKADSWSTDGHKWLNVPYDCGYAFVRDAAAHRGSMAAVSSYLVQGGGARDEVDWTPEFSRRARGFATYAALRQLGREGVADLVERCCRHAHAIVMGIGALEGAAVLCQPVINQGIVRFHSSEPGADEADHDRFTDRVMMEVRRSGEAFFTGTTWRGKRGMRVSVSNWSTTDKDVGLTVAAVGRVLARLRTEQAVLPATL